MEFVSHPLLKPRALEVRLYQQLILETAAKANTLVVLPTGMGKTYLAIMLASLRLGRFPKSKVLVMAPTRPLVLQHLQSFRSFMTLPSEQLQPLTGQLEPSKRARVWKEAKLVFATPQVVQRDLLAGRANLREFSLAVFDEAHRAVKRYPYVFVAERYMREAEAPLILALTASPGAEPERVEEVKQNLFVERVEIRTERDEDVKPYLQPIEVEWRRVELPQAFLDVKSLLEAELKEYLRVLRRHGFLPSIKRVGKRELLELQERVQRRVQELGPDEKLSTCLVAQAAALRLCHAVELLETQGLGTLELYLLRLFNRARQPGSPKALKLLAQSPRVQQAYYIAQRLQGQVEHPKIPEALRILREQFTKRPSSRVIVFAHYRDSAQALVRVLNEQLGVRAERFVGQASRESEEGLSQREQAEILERFKRGEVNVLVSTSVGEEGLDIPSVDLVLFYEAVPSEIRLIQRRGRTGRVRPGRVVALLAKGTRDETYFWSAVQKEKQMREALRERKPGLKERKLEDYVAPPRVRVVVDHREMPSGVVQELAKLGVEVEARQLEVGDFILSDRVGVERKSVGDFLQSIVDKRLLAQAKQLSETFERPILILEGEGLYTRRAIHPNAIRGALAALAVDFGVAVIPTRDERETAAVLAIIAQREQTERAREVAIRGEAKGLTLPEQQRFLVEGLPGVSAVLAERLLAHFKNPERVMMASEQELQRVPGIGKVKAKEIRRVLTKLYQPSG